MPAPLPAPPLPTVPVRAGIPGAPVVPFERYMLDSDDPKVTAEVEAYRPVFVLGEVKKAGQFPYVNAMTVEMAVAIAEGYSERANQRKVRVTRRFGGVMSTVMVPTDYPLQPGDTIYVLERFF
jgi:polysaccharide export outer membrane protein